MPCPVPQDALLQRYVGQGVTYTDCYEAVVPAQIDLAQYITAFYKTPLFRAERMILSIWLRHRITDGEVVQLASGQSDHFAAWRVEARAKDQLLLCDISGHTRSWFGLSHEGQMQTRLWFGSAVVSRQGQPLARVARLSLPVHKVYSRLLLGSASKRLSGLRLSD